MLNPGDPEIAIRTRTVGINAVWFLLNVVAGLGYFYRRGGFGRYAILIILAIDIVNAVFAAVSFAVQSDPGTAVEWVAFALIPAAALVLVWLRSGRPAAPVTGG